MGMFAATLETGGSQTITATDMAKTTITGATSPISVTAGASRFVLTVPPTATVGTAFNFTVTALDASGRTDASYSGTVHFTSTDGQAVLPSNSTLTNGTANFSATLKTLGSGTITAVDTTTDLINGISNSIQVFATAAAFTATGSMVSAREAHTATLLNDGKVLVAGGDNGNVVLAKAELFDPGNGNFTTTGTMQTERKAHTATLLTGGKVLIAGGRNDSGSLATAELYDPGTGNFTTTGSMGTGRNMQTATALNDGKVLVAGGIDTNGNALATAELFDPNNGSFNNGSFTATGSMTTARFWHTATLLNDGKVLIAGGDNGVGSLATAELYDPVTGNFTTTGSMKAARSLHTATSLKNGKVLIAGPDQTAELFDPNTGKFTPTGSMTTDTVRWYHTATLRNDGTVLVAGGEYYSSGLCTGPLPNSTATAELFDPTSGTFAATRDMAAMRSSHAATLLPNGDVLVTGGIKWSYASLPGCPKMTVSVEASAELYK
jgi:hypothetical protein